MAASAEALDIILRLQGVPTYTAGMAEASGANDEFAASSKRAGAASNEAAAASERQKGAAALVGKAMKGTGLILAAAGVEGVRMAIKFERQMELIHTQAGASQGEVERLKKSVLGLAGSVPQGPEELAKALYHLESVGLRGAKAMDALKISAQGAAVGNANIEDTATALGAAWIVGAKGAGNLHNVMGILNATVGAGNVRMEELVQSLGSGIIPVTKVAHISIQDIGAALATLTDSGYNASSGMAQLGTSLHFLYDPTSKARKALESIGLTSQQVFKEMAGPNGLHGALALLKTHLEGAGGQAEQAEKIGEILPGGRGKVLLTLIEELERFEMKKKQIIANSGNFDQNVKATMEQPAIRIQKAWSAFQAELIRLGLSLEGPAAAAMIIFAKEAGVVLALILALTDKGKLLAPIIFGIATAWLVYKGAVRAAAIAQFAYNSAMGLFALISLIPEIRSLADAWFLLDAAMDANPVGVIALGILAVGVAVAMLIMHFKAVISFLRGPWGTVLLLMMGPAIAFPVLLAIHFKLVLKVFSDAISWIGKNWSKVGHVLAYPFEWMWGKVTWIFKQIKKGISDIVNSPGSILKSIGGGLGDIGHAIGIPGLAAGGTMNTGGFALINESQSGEVVYLPGGSTVQPSAASSLLNPRAHTPNPAPLDGGTPVYIEAVLLMPNGAGRTMFKLVTKEAAIKGARK